MTGELMDDPNRQAVGLDPAWVEGTGGSDNVATPTAKRKGGRPVKSETEAPTPDDDDGGEDDGK